MYSLFYWVISSPKAYKWGWFGVGGSENGSRALSHIPIFIPFYINDETKGVNGLSKAKILYLFQREKSVRQRGQAGRLRWGRRKIKHLKMKTLQPIFLFRNWQPFGQKGLFFLETDSFRICKLLICFSFWKQAALEYVKLLCD